MDNNNIISLLSDWAPAFKEHGPFDVVQGDGTFLKKQRAKIAVYANHLVDGLLPEDFQCDDDIFPLVINGHREVVIPELSADIYSQLADEFSSLIDFSSYPYIRQDLVDEFNRFDQERLDKIGVVKPGDFKPVLDKPVNLRVRISEKDSFGPVCFTVETNYGWWLF